MKTLVYTLAIGDECWSQIYWMVQSLRKLGGFGGDIKVFTDKKRGGLTDATLEVLPDLITLRRPQMGKSLIGKQLPVADYDRIVWMDADVVTVRDVARIFELPGLSLPVEVVVNKESDRISYSYEGNLCSLGTTGLNTGLVVCESKIWQWVCQTWWDRIRDMQAWNHALVDQPAMNCLIREDKLQANQMRAGVMHFLVPYASDFGPDTVFVHARDKCKEAQMRMVYQMVEHFSK